MKDDERQMVNWFKNQLKSYLSSAPIRKKLREKIAELNNLLEYHSPALTSEVHVSGKPHDEKLADYVTKKEEYTEQLETLLVQEKAIESILKRINTTDRDSIIRIYTGRKTMENEAIERCESVPALQRRIDGVILKAIKRYLSGM